MYTILPDTHFTRRRTAHFVLDDHLEVVFSAAKFVDCLRWLNDNGQYSVRVKSETQEYGIDIAPI